MAHPFLPISLYCSLGSHERRTPRKTQYEMTTMDMDIDMKANHAAIPAWLSFGMDPSGIDVKVYSQHDHALLANEAL